MQKVTPLLILIATAVRKPMTIVMRTIMPTVLILLLASATVVLAQNTAPKADVPTIQDNPFTTHNNIVYRGYRYLLLRSAEKMPEEYYSFRPTDAVRTYGQILGHVVDAQYGFCAAVLGEKNPLPNIEKSKTSKADLIAAIKDGFAYCDRAYSGMTDALGATTVMYPGRGNVSKLAMLNTNLLHMTEHYGNLVTYMRMKNIVPPTSEAPVLPQSPKK